LFWGMRMPDKLYINGTEIPANLVLKYPVFSESISFDSTFTIPDSAEVELVNGQNQFNPAVSGSFLNGCGIYTPVEVYNSDLDKTTFQGTIANVTVDAQRVTLDVRSDLSTVIDKGCNYNKSSIEPATAIYEILTQVPVQADTDSITLAHPKILPSGLIQPEMIVKATFDDAARYQYAKKCMVSVSSIDTDSNNNTNTIGDIIGQLCRLGHCSIFTYANLVYVYQWKEHTGTTCQPITKADIVAGSISWQYATDEAYAIRNQYRIAFTQQDSILWATGKDDSSIDKYGLKRFCIPEDNEDSSASEDYRAVVNNYAGATWIGSMALERFAQPTITMSMALKYSLNELRLGSEITLQVAPYTGWTLVIVERDVDRSSGRIDIKGIRV
jgi:hypothetical protein